MISRCWIVFKRLCAARKLEWVDMMFHYSKRQLECYYLHRCTNNVSSLSLYAMGWLLRFSGELNYQRLKLEELDNKSDGDSKEMPGLCRLASV